MKISLSRALAARAAVGLLAWLMTFCIAAPSVQAVTTGNLVVDPSFEVNPLIPFIQILGPPYTSGAWGAESATISGPADGITPANGLLMLSMTDDGNVATQAFQFVDVTAYTATISAGLVTVDASALYNVPADIAAGVASVNVGYYNSAHAFLSADNFGGTLDSSVSTWEILSITGASVPTATQYMLIQVAFSNISMINALGQSRPGYVDSAVLTLTGVPEPSGVVLAAAGLIALGVSGWHRLRRRNRE